MTAPYLLSAAAAWERILTEMHPDQDWIVSVREHGTDDEGLPAATVGVEEAGAVTHDPHTLGGRDDAPATDLANDHGLEKAA